MTLLLILGFVWLSLIAFLVIQFHRAPHGYQDERGFHFVKATKMAPQHTAAPVSYRYLSTRLAQTSFIR